MKLALDEIAEIIRTEQPEYITRVENGVLIVEEKSEVEARDKK